MNLGSVLFIVYRNQSKGTLYMSPPFRKRSKASLFKWKPHDYLKHEIKLLSNHCDTCKSWGTWKFHLRSYGWFMPLIGETSANGLCCRSKVLHSFRQRVPELDLCQPGPVIPRKAELWRKELLVLFRSNDHPMMSDEEMVPMGWVQQLLQTLLVLKFYEKKSQASDNFSDWSTGNWACLRPS